MLFDKDGNIHTKSKEIANMLQHQFTSVFSNPLDTNLASAEFSIPPVQHHFSDSNISEIKPNASPGPDEIPTVLLSNCMHAVAKPIYLICSMSHLATNHQSLLPCTKNIVVQFHPTIDLFPSPLMSRSSDKETTCDFPGIKQPTLLTPTWVSFWSQLSYTTTASF